MRKKILMSFFKDKHKYLPFILPPILFSTWFLTPISNVLVSEIILPFVPIEEDINLGQQSWRESMRSQYPLVYDQWGVKEIGEELIRSTTSRNYFCEQLMNKKQFIKFIDREQCKRQLRKYKWKFQVVESPQINAFALPGGIISVTNSLLEHLQLTRSEIAALLGHEIGHVLYRHSQARLLKQNILQYLLQTIVYEDGDDKDESFGEALGELMLKGANFLGEMKFSRDNEYEADDAAWDILVSSKIHNPRSVQRLLEKLLSMEGKGNFNGWINGWDRTHPGAAERIKALQER